MNIGHAVQELSPSKPVPVLARDENFATGRDDYPRRALAEAKSLVGRSS